MRRQLLLGCGTRMDKAMGITRDGIPDTEWEDLVRLDCYLGCKPDVCHDLNIRPLPFDDNEFDELHAYEVLEHLGKQGDWQSFFEEFTEYWRILKPGGFLFATVPSRKSPWAWGDPGHTRIILPETLVFLSQKHYTQVGHTPMADYRPWFKADFNLCQGHDDGEHFKFILQARKQEQGTQ